MKYLSSFVFIGLISVVLFAQKPTPSYEELISMVHEGKSNQCQALITEFNIPVDGSGESIPLLYFVCSQGDTSFVSFLLDKGADMYYFTEYGFPVQWAVEKNKFEVVEQFLDRGYNPRAEEMAFWMDLYVNSDSVLPGMDWLVKKINSDSLSYINESVNAFSDPSDNLILSQLVKTPNLRHRAMAMRIIKSGYNVNLVDKYGHSALFYAVFARHTPAVKLLISSGADVNMMVYRPEMAKTLQNPYFDSNLNVMTSLLQLFHKNPRKYYDHQEDWLRIIGLLINAGVDINIATKEGQTALMLAKKFGDKRLYKAVKRGN